MDTLLKSFGIGFFLRSILSGAFFMLSYGTASGLYPIKPQEVSVPLIVTISVFAGATVYCLHRAMFYPAIEWFFDTNYAGQLRLRSPLIATHTIIRILNRWNWSSTETEHDKTLFTHTSAWADTTHFLYTSALAVALGSLSACVIQAKWLPVNIPLVLLVILLFIGALISDWRLHCFHDHIFKIKMS